MVVPLTICSLLATPPSLQVTTQNQRAQVLQAAQAIRQQLDGSPTLAVAPQVGVPRAQVVEDPLEEAAALLAEAGAAFTRLAIEQVSAKLTDVEAILRLQLDNPKAVELFAQTLRLKARTLLLSEESDEASAAFVSASFLDPQFSPAAEIWPPETRLAYGDAIAAARRGAAGSLSIRVEPDIGEVWLDGTSLGVGPTTVQDVTPGQHHLLVTCPGHSSFAAVVDVEGGGKLDQATVYLERSEPTLHNDVVTALASAFDNERETVVAGQAVRILDVDGIILVAGEASPVAWVFDSAGKRMGGFIAAQSAPAAVLEIERRFNEIMAPPPPPREEWYEKWYTWVAAGAVVVGTSVAVILLVDGNSSDRVTLHFGDPP